jgi:uncharacterized repeat protein (TIGR02543 family)
LYLQYFFVKILYTYINYEKWKKGNKYIFMKKCNKIMVMVLGLLLGLCACFVSPDNTPVSASSTCKVTFNYNISQIDAYLPKDRTLRQSLDTYSVDVEEGGYAVESKKPLSAISTYYTYEWRTATGEHVDLDTYRVYRSIILYAKWTPVEYTIYYNYLTTQEATEITNLMNSEKYTIESPKIKLYQPNRPHYVFMGWYRINEPKEWKWVETGSTGDFVLYAKWRPLEYSIRYNTDGDNSRNPVSYNIEDDEYVLASADKEGHIFKGWYLDKELTIPVTSIPAGSTGNLNLYPKWDLEKYEVTYVLPNKTKQTIVVQYGKTAPLPDIDKSIFEIVKTNISRKNITGDTTIEIQVINIWYVYVLAFLVIAGIITTIIVIKKRRDRILSRLRYMYQSNSNKKY